MGNPKTNITENVIPQFHENKNVEGVCFAGKVYVVELLYDVKLQADNHVRWDVVPSGTEP